MAKSISSDRYIRQFAPDGEHFVTERGKVTVEKALDWLVSHDVILHKALMPQARARIVNVNSGRIIER